MVPMGAKAQTPTSAIGSERVTEANPPARSQMTRVSTSAFTLLELMVVIVLIGILTAAILPEMRGTYQDALLRSTSRELINVFGLASSRAVSLNQVHRVRLDEKTGHYQLERRVRNRKTGEEFAPVEDDFGSHGELDTRISILIHPPGESVPAEPTEEPAPPPTEAPGPADQLNTIAFYPDGTTDGGDIQLQDRDGFRFVLRLNPVTARVHVVELARQ
jgi:type II secretion system protein H